MTFRHQNERNEAETMTQADYRTRRAGRPCPDCISMEAAVPGDLTTGSGVAALRHRLAADRRAADDEIGVYRLTPQGRRLREQSNSEIEATLDRDAPAVTDAGSVRRRRCRAELRRT